MFLDLFALLGTLIRRRRAGEEDGPFVPLLPPPEPSSSGYISLENELARMKVARDRARRTIRRLRRSGSRTLASGYEAALRHVLERIEALKVRLRRAG